MKRLAFASALILAACGAHDGSNESSQASGTVDNASARSAQADDRSEGNALQSASFLPNAQAAKPGVDDRAAVDMAPALTRERLLGRWTSPDSGTCGGGDAAVDLRSDGSYVTSEGDGRWRLEGTTLHMTNWGGAPAQLEMRANGDLAVTWDYGSEIWRRCPS